MALSIDSMRAILAFALAWSTGDVDAYFAALGTAFHEGDAQ
jgi:hypothetical protein